MKKYFLFLLLLVLPLLAFAEGGRTIAVLFDISKSIPAKDFQQAREAAAQLLRDSEANDQITFYSFGDSLKKIGPVDLQQVQPTQSRTMLYDAAYDVAQEMSNHRAARKAILIISDGNDTSSATVLEDIVAYAKQQGIAIYGIGAGKVNRRSLERIAKLTGGKVYAVQDPALVAEVNKSIDAQNAAAAALSSATVPVPAPARTSASQAQVKVRPVRKAATIPQPAQEKSGNAYVWIAGGIGGILLVMVVGFVVVRSLREAPRSCPTCGRRLESYETICTCVSPQVAPTVQVQISQGAEITERIPKELLKKQPVTEEDLSRTYVLMETPMLVVRKGRNLGQSYSLHRAFPVSIGRSKVNEILLEDVAVSGQHCRIIPENGKHVLYDLGSTNGTFVNDQKVNEVMLKEGDTIKIGETQFVFRIEQHRN